MDFGRQRHLHRRTWAARRSATRTATRSRPVRSGTFQVETGKIAITKYGLVRNPRTHLWSGTIKLTNTGSSAFSGPIFVLFNLPAGAILENATGTYNGLPYLEVNIASLAAGATTSATVVFNYERRPLRLLNVVLPRQSGIVISSIVRDRKKKVIA